MVELNTQFEKHKLLQTGPKWEVKHLKKILNNLQISRVFLLRNAHPLASSCKFSTGQRYSRRPTHEITQKTCWSVTCSNRQLQQVDIILIWNMINAFFNTSVQWNGHRCQKTWMDEWMAIQMAHEWTMHHYITSFYSNPSAHHISGFLSAYKTLPTPLKYLWMCIFKPAAVLECVFESVA